VLAVELRPEETRRSFQDLVRAIHLAQFLAKPSSISARLTHDLKDSTP
jgi:hypothetical protein